MANQNLFSAQAAQSSAVLTTNEAGGAAYRLSPRQSLAQYAATDA